jgi:nitrile hydratase
MTALATMLVEAGQIDPAELASRAGGAFPLSRSAAELRVPQLQRPDAPPRFAAGSEVVVRNLHPLGHTRCPRYVRGKRGTVIRVDGAFALPDIAAHDRRPCRETSYGVRFAARELWGDDAAANQSIAVDLWESYLEPA